VALAVKFDNQEKLEKYLRLLDRVPAVVPPASPKPEKPTKQS
jgi:hypothetical protein